MVAVNFQLDFEKRVQIDPFLGQSLLDALDGETPVSVRLHPSKTKPALDFLVEIPWCENGFYLKERPSFTLDPLFHAGCYYPQEAGSMVLDTILRSIPLPEEPVVLDLCAAPGGKSTLIASFLDGKGLLVSNEVIHQRSRILKENLAKWGYSNVVVTNNDPKDFERLPNFFDVAVIDAPCSGSGTWRRNPDAKWRLRPGALAERIKEQAIVLDRAARLAKKGGRIAYITCSLLPEENDDAVEAFLARHSGFEVIEPGAVAEKAGLGGLASFTSPKGHGLQLTALRCGTDGFYVSLLRRAGCGAVIASAAKRSSLGAPISGSLRSARDDAFALKPASAERASSCPSRAWRRRRH
jgi:16S rRNA C967 or C1407 C5-methylase (RsmB/RsmF family)